mgnify:CR=1 FL=1
MYVAIQHPDDIEDSRRDGLTNYLTLGEADEDSSVVGTEQKQEEEPETYNIPDDVKRLANVFNRAGKPGNKETMFEKAREKGFDDEDIRQAWQLADIDN